MLRMLLAIVIGFYSSLALAWPTKPVTLIVPFSPGGLSDSFARAMAQDLEKRLNTTVIVRNMPGGTMTVATSHILSQDNDNHTFMTATSDIVIGSITQRTGHHERFVATNVILTFSAFVLGNNTASPEKFRRQIQSGSEINIGNVGALGSSHLWTVNLQGIKVNPVPYKGQAPLTMDVIGGQIEYGITSTISMLPLIQEGKVTPVMYADSRRHPNFPHVPTYREMGLSGEPLGEWLGIVARKDTDPEILRRFAATVRDIATNNSWIQTQRERGMNLSNLSLDDSTKQFNSDIARVSRYKW